MSAPARVCLVTGGTGFVGSAVVARLCARGCEVHVLARAISQRGVLEGLRVVWHEGDLTDAPSLERAVGDAAHAARERGVGLEVVHSAARISYRRRDAGALRATNVEGTRALLAACRLAQVKRFCHVSSVVALGCAADESAWLGDDAALAGHLLRCGYARTKCAAEELVLAATSELDVVVASPAVVFGPTPRGSNTLRFLGRVARGALGPLSPPGSLSVVGLADAAEGIALALERGARGRRYLLSESTWTLLDLLRLASEAFGRAGPRWRLGAGAWSVLVAGAELVDRLRPMEHATPEALRLLGLHFRFRARAAREELGWSPRAFTAVLSETAGWMRERGLAG